MSVFRTKPEAFVEAAVKHINFTEVLVKYVSTYSLFHG